jgi:hypothetical protein
MKGRTWARSVAGATILSATTSFLPVGPVLAGADSFVGTDFHVQTSDGFHIRVREVRGNAAETTPPE